MRCSSRYWCSLPPFTLSQFFEGVQKASRRLDHETHREVSSWLSDHALLRLRSFAEPKEKAFFSSQSWVKSMTGEEITAHKGLLHQWKLTLCSDMLQILTWSEVKRCDLTLVSFRSTHNSSSHSTFAFSFSLICVYTPWWRLFHHWKSISIAVDSQDSQIRAILWTPLIFPILLSIWPTSLFKKRRKTTTVRSDATTSCQLYSISLMLIYSMVENGIYTIWNASWWPSTGWIVWMIFFSRSSVWLSSLCWGRVNDLKCLQTLLLLQCRKDHHQW